MQEVVVQTAGWIRSDIEVETVDVTLGYDPVDPYAVRLDINSHDRQITWVFGRDLLADGLRSMVPIGDGDVRVQATSVLTEITFTSAGQVGVLRLPWWNTREFVRLTQVEVPRGQERCDVDAWVAALTATPDA
jgi:Streptomyces sporulation and cell division protein, SsgA